ncbi:hypothetical protein AMAG_10818 [Allomyces macrogynus ATCC 38327]|uniref:rRNA-processing protein FYV7 n=1 Tax=Allomyces macrogynus (strain ATCC 38327) TaxID=578462 RepID=A0A0L0SS19_ALLM3|nr:hypothetical protein AMAG_10818 [Allomyces macrogynus ATCC 38327]|eukprot:KNE65165.1 hypothetical protein AMAG_10818 [Allomyces macrogynus ATCC 38327]
MKLNSKQKLIHNSRVKKSYAKLLAKEGYGGPSTPAITEDEATPPGNERHSSLLPDDNEAELAPRRAPQGKLAGNRSYSSCSPADPFPKIRISPLVPFLSTRSDIAKAVAKAGAKNRNITALTGPVSKPNPFKKAFEEAERIRAEREREVQERLRKKQDVAKAKKSAQRKRHHEATVMNKKNDRGQPNMRSRINLLLDKIQGGK